ncbi:MAG: hypothetical protein QXS85_04215 [Acidilobaceae archaeon]
MTSRRFVFIYGVSGSGKTRLALHVARLASESGLSVLLVETEPVKSIVSRLYEGEIRSVSSFDELARVVAQAALSNRYLVVDSVNSLYLDEPPLARRRTLAFIASMLKKTGGLAVGQARLREDGGITSPGLELISVYADVIAQSQKVGENKFKLEVLKPERRVMLFRVLEADVEWL